MEYFKKNLKKEISKALQSRQGKIKVAFHEGNIFSLKITMDCELKDFIGLTNQIKKLYHVEYGTLEINSKKDSVFESLISIRKRI